ncbi:phosphatidate cytidylyltransferase [Bordetella genomosp. 13]|uniref:phosphatidate cytidylyltransferase n=1 Tax=Bordetella genomosp. 13 TaxID=463040 RepID=UPI0011A26924|nr:phosphatidate cytidylyltransferase [Bordetella genomosp. 13]
MNTDFWRLALGIIGFLAASTVFSHILVWRVGRDNPTIRNLAERVDAWWLLVGIGIPAIAAGRAPAIVLFAFASFLSLREFLSLTPTRPGDRPALFAAFFVAIPAQYVLVGANWYGLFAIFLPVYGFLVISALTAVAQDTQHYLERTAKIQWSVMVCVYGISHAPALMFLDIPGYDAADGVLLLFFLLVTQISDVLQYVCGKLFGRHKLAPALSPSKTWEGLIGGGLLATAVGTALYSFTPFRPWQAGLLALAIVVAGVIGGLVLSAVKRSLGAKDWGASIPGHGGMLDRMDSIAFAAPIFFHLTRFWYG